MYVRHVGVAYRLGDGNLALSLRSTNLGIAYAGILQNLLHTVGVLLLHLYDNTRVLGKEQLHHVTLLYLVEVELQTALGVCEAHLEQCGYDTACADVVTCQHEPLLHHLLYGEECIAEILWVLHRRNIRTHLAQTLCEGRTAQLQSVEGEVYIVQARSLHVLYHWAHGLLHVVHLSASTHNHGAWGDNLLAVRIFLRHGERVLTRWHVYLQVAAEVRQSLHSLVETRILTFLRTTWPHPVC